MGVIAAFTVTLVVWQIFSGRMLKTRAQKSICTYLQLSEAADFPTITAHMQRRESELRTILATYFGPQFVYFREGDPRDMVTLAIHWEAVALDKRLVAKWPSEIRAHATALRSYAKLC